MTSVKYRTPGAQRRRCRRVVAAAFALVGLPVAQAQTVLPEAYLGASYAETLDSNVTRRQGGPASTIEQPAILAGYNRALSQQQFGFTAAIGRTYYREIPLFNSSNQDIDATLSTNVAYGSSLNLEVHHSVTLANQADFSSVQRNLLNQNLVSLRADVPIYERYSFVVLGNRNRVSNSNGLDVILNSVDNEVGAGFHYQTGKQNYIDLRYRSDRVAYVDSRALVAGLSALDTRNFEVSTRWALTAASEIDGHAGLQTTRFALYAFRDFSGPTFDLTYVWSPDDQFHTSLQALRSVGIPGDNGFLTAITRGVRVTPHYDVTQKMYVEAAYARNWLQFTGNLELVAQGLAPVSTRVDHTRSVQVSSGWNPKSWLQLSLSAHWDSRLSNVSQWLYGDRIINGQIQAKVW